MKLGGYGALRIGVAKDRVDPASPDRRPVRLPDGTIRAQPVAAGDVLILVQSRGPLFSDIIRELKGAGSAG